MKLVHVKPVSGHLDNRSLPDEVEQGSWRKRLNFTIGDVNRLTRAPGWSKLFSKQYYNNADLHDQLLPLLGRTDKQPIIFLQELISTTGTRKLVAGTRNTLYVLNEATHNWQVIADDLGGTNTRWQAAQVLDWVVFNNDYDPPMAWMFGAKPDDASSNALLEIESLEPINLTRAGCVAAWKGVLFMGDVLMDGQRFESKVVWSNYQNPTDLDPATPGTIAGYQDLNYGERVLAMAPLGDYLLIYTNRGIWQVTVVGSSAENSFNFRQSYSEPSGDACLFYRNTLVNIGGGHLFCGSDGIYLYNLSMGKPERVEWIHKGTYSMFESIDPTRCDEAIAGYHPHSKRAMFFWPESNEDYPVRGLEVSFASNRVSEVDYGMTALTSYQSDTRESLRDWLARFCVCSYDELAAMDGFGFVREGLPRADQESPSCDTTPTAIFTNEIINIYGIEAVENWTKATADATSLCSILEAQGYYRIEDFCRDCRPVPIFIGASAYDWCLKEYTEVYSREMLDSQASGGTVTYGGSSCYRSGLATYRFDGYYSELIIGPIDLTDAERLLQKVEIEFNSQPQSFTTAEMRLFVGVASQAVDPLGTDCVIVWHEQTVNRRYIECQSIYTEAQHKALNTRPKNTLDWPLHYRGRYAYLRFRVQDRGGGTPIGAVAQFSRLTMGVL